MAFALESKHFFPTSAIWGQVRGNVAEGEEELSQNNLELVEEEGENYGFGGQYLEAHLTWCKTCWHWL